MKQFDMTHQRVSPTHDEAKKNCFRKRNVQVYVQLYSYRIPLQNNQSAMTHTVAVSFKDSSAVNYNPLPVHCLLSCL